MLLRNQTPMFQSFCTEVRRREDSELSFFIPTRTGMGGDPETTSYFGWGGLCVLPCNAAFLSANNMAAVRDSA